MNEFFPTHIAGQIITFCLVTALVFWLALMVGIRRTGADESRQRQLGAIVAGVLAIWFLVAFWTASRGVYTLQGDRVLEPIVIALFIPLAAGILLLMSARYRGIIDAIPQHWLAGHHALRIVFGLMFLAIYEMGEIPAEFGLSGGYGDISSGLLGAGAAYLSFGRRRYAVAALVLWNAVGILDFVTILPLGITKLEPSAPFQNFYPFFLIPVYVVPMFFLFHVYSVRALMRKAA